MSNRALIYLAKAAAEATEVAQATETHKRQILQLCCSNSHVKSDHATGVIHVKSSSRTLGVAQRHPPADIRH